MSQGQPNQPMDMRIMAIAVLICAALLLTGLGDLFVYEKVPVNWVQKICALPVLLVSHATDGQRLVADSLACALYLVIFAVVGAYSWKLFVRKILEPRQAKDFVKRQKRMEEHINEARHDE